MMMIIGISIIKQHHHPRMLMLMVAVARPRRLSQAGQAGLADLAGWLAQRGETIGTWPETRVAARPPEFPADFTAARGGGTARAFGAAGDL